jgi:hypothetical protein
LAWTGFRPHRHHRPLPAWPVGNLQSSRRPLSLR